MSLISVSRSVPDEWMVLANSTCFGVRFPGPFSLSCWPRIRMELSGVRSSWDVREELGLVLRGERELRGLLLERAAGLLDLLLLALHFGVLFRELPGL